MAQQTVQILRTTTNNPPPTLLPGSFSVELGTDTRLWMGAVGGNRLLLSTNPSDVTLSGYVVVSAVAPPTAYPGVLWYDTVSGQLFVRYNDGNTIQWVAVTVPSGSLNLQAGPGLTLNAGTNPPTIDVATPYLARTGGALAGPGNLTVGGTLGVTGVSTLTGGIAGPLTVTGNETVSGAVVVGNAVASPAARSLVINDTATAPQPAGFNPRLWAASEGGAYLVLDDYGVDRPGLILRRSRGTAAAPTAVQNGDPLGTVEGWGRGATGYASRAQLQLFAAENWTDTAQGTAIVLSTTPTGGAAAVNSLTVAGNSATFSGSVSSGATAGAPNASFVLFDPSSSHRADLTFFNSTGQLQLSNTAPGPNSSLYLPNDGSFGVTSSLAVKPGGGSWSAPSSATVKTDIVPWNEGLQAVLALEPVSYRYTGEHGLPTDQSFVGLIHEDVALDELKGTATLGEAELDTIDPGPLVFALINAVKELTARLEALEGAR
jgi:hypothetical protein